MSSPQKFSTPQSKKDISSNESEKHHHHYTHLTYALRRKNEGETDAANSLSSRARRLVAKEAPPLRPLKLISGFAISEEGHLMSRFVSPPRFGVNTAENPSSPLTSSSSSLLQSNSPLSPQQRAFQATVTITEDGVPRLTVPSVATIPTAHNIQKQQQQNKERGGVGGGGDPWTQLQIVSATAGMSEFELALLEWTSICKLFEFFGITQDPIERARTELTWRKKHDRAVLESASQHQQRYERLLFAQQQEQQKKALLLQQQQSSSSSSSLKNKKTKMKTNSNNNINDSILNNNNSNQSEEIQRATEEFKNFVEQLYPTPPIMKAAGGPVLLVRTAPQGEIAIDRDAKSPRTKNQKKSNNANVNNDSFHSYGIDYDEKPYVHLTPRRKKTLGGDNNNNDNDNSNDEFVVRHKNIGPESSPLKKPAFDYYAKRTKTPPPSKFNN